LKKILRKKLLKKRKKNYVEISSKHNLNIYKVLKKNYQNIKTIGGYVPINYEFDCLKLLQLLEKKNYIICLPVTGKNYVMNFYKYSFSDPLKINKLGIGEPIKLSKKTVPDLIFVPLVGYDKYLNRLGYGGGFYDRYFQKNQKLKKIIKIGLAFSSQKIKKLPTDKFDKKLNKIITEKKI
tara:strand:+ start:766 stop:1305 length:540 start_codon:yes stop_codon:yes gene_type:complete